ncbi:hypothetical protein Q4519_07705 [Motilimonas sp. 1_MG-2023]|uniref:hypothetical protein n=1 Tax=Motilimonas sp. 1_MG-2023 TaxID=3062672 RepID=UPI0026E2505C|nr:hypothetical protein [Motilimonas sp. 1_MG-2023]MDO6525566.1 hypothetical protein [Motilimonas sp. 1_MG-2023]
MLCSFATTEIVGVTKIDQVKQSVDGLNKTKKYIEASYKLADKAVNKPVTVNQDFDTSANEFIATIAEKLKAYFGQSVGNSFVNLADKILTMLPEVVKSILSDLAPAAGDIKNALLGIKTALTKYITYNSTLKVQQSATCITAGDAIYIIRQELLNVVKENSVIALGSTGAIVLTLATAGVGGAIATLVKAGIAVFNFFTNLFDTWVMEEKFTSFAKSCSSETFNNDEEFSAWLKGHMMEIPILASYIVCNPMYGHVFNFLNVVDVIPPPPTMLAHKTGNLVARYHKFRGTEPTPPKLARQKSIIDAYNTLKKEAKGFIGKGKIKLESRDPATEKMFRHARGLSNIIPGENEENFLSRTDKIKKYATSRLSKLYARLKA